MATPTTNILPFPSTLNINQCSDCFAVVILPPGADTGSMYLVFCDEACEDNFRRKYNLRDEWEHISA